jgi:hypothetical protein
MKMKVVKALVVEVCGSVRTYRSPAQAARAITEEMVWRVASRNKTKRWLPGQKERMYRRAYPKVRRIVEKALS